MSETRVQSHHQEVAQQLSHQLLEVLSSASKKGLAIEQVLAELGADPKFQAFIEAAATVQNKKNEIQEQGEQKIKDLAEPFVMKMIIKKMNQLDESEDPRHGEIKAFFIQKQELLKQPDAQAWADLLKLLAPIEQEINGPTKEKKSRARSDLREAQREVSGRKKLNVQSYNQVLETALKGENSQGAQAWELHKRTAYLRSLEERVAPSLIFDLDAVYKNIIAEVGEPNHEEGETWQEWETKHKDKLNKAIQDQARAQFNEYIQGLKNNESAVKQKIADSANNLKKLQDVLDSLELFKDQAIIYFADLKTAQDLILALNTNTALTPTDANNLLYPRTLQEFDDTVNGKLPSVDEFEAFFKRFFDMVDLMNDGKRSIVALGKTVKSLLAETNQIHEPFFRKVINKLFKSSSACDDLVSIAGDSPNPQTVRELNDSFNSEKVSEGPNSGLFGDIKTALEETFKLKKQDASVEYQKHLYDVQNQSYDIINGLKNNEFFTAALEVVSGQERLDSAVQYLFGDLSESSAFFVEGALAKLIKIASAGEANMAQVLTSYEKGRERSYVRLQAEFDQKYGTPQDPEKLHDILTAAIRARFQVNTLERDIEKYSQQLESNNFHGIYLLAESIAKSIPFKRERVGESQIEYRQQLENEAQVLRAKLKAQLEAKSDVSGENPIDVGLVAEYVVAHLRSLLAGYEGEIDPVTLVKALKEQLDAHRQGWEQFLGVLETTAADNLKAEQKQVDAVPVNEMASETQESGFQKIKMILGAVSPEIRHLESEIDGLEQKTLPLASLAGRLNRYEEALLALQNKLDSAFDVPIGVGLEETEGERNVLAVNKLGMTFNKMKELWKGEGAAAAATNGSSNAMPVEFEQLPFITEHTAFTTQIEDLRKRVNKLRETQITPQLVEFSGVLASATTFNDLVALGQNEKYRALYENAGKDLTVLQGLGTEQSQTRLFGELHDQTLEAKLESLFTHSEVRQAVKKVVEQQAARAEEYLRTLATRTYASLTEFSREMREHVGAYCLKKAADGQGWITGYVIQRTVYNNEVLAAQAGAVRNIDTLPQDLEARNVIPEYGINAKVVELILSEYEQQTHQKLTEAVSKATTYQSLIEIIQDPQFALASMVRSEKPWTPRQQIDALEYAWANLKVQGEAFDSQSYLEGLGVTTACGILSKANELLLKHPSLKLSPPENGLSPEDRRNYTFYELPPTTPNTWEIGRDFFKVTTKLNTVDEPNVGAVSGSHGTIERGSTGYYYRDHSSNGTTINPGQSNQVVAYKTDIAFAIRTGTTLQLAGLIDVKVDIRPDGSIYLGVRK